MKVYSGIKVWRAAGCPEVGELYEINRQAKMQYKYAVRRLKRAAYNIKKDKLLTGLLDGGLDIFQEIKKFRGKTSTVSSSVDGHTGAEDISNHSADIYSELYQKHDLGEEFARVQGSIVLQVDPSLLGELDRVNEKIVFEALTKLKSGKSDPTFSFNSDCLSNSCDDLIKHVTILFKWFLRILVQFLHFCFFIL